MNRTKNLQGTCKHCGSSIEFPAELVGTTTQCPHCGQQTELLLATPPQESGVPRRMIVWTVVAIVISVLGLVGLLVALNWAEKWVGRRGQSGAERVATGLEVSDLKVEQAAGGAPGYATGLVTNLLERKRVGVKVELELLDASGHKAGTLSCGPEALEPHGDWRFKVPVGNLNAVSAQVALIKEGQ